MFSEVNLKITKNCVKRVMEGKLKMVKGKDDLYYNLGSSVRIRVDGYMLQVPVLAEDGITLAEGEINIKNYDHVDLPNVAMGFTAVPLQS